MSFSAKRAGPGYPQWTRRLAALAVGSSRDRRVRRASAGRPSNRPWPHVGDTATGYGGGSLLLTLEREDPQPRPALGLQLLRPVLARRGEAHDERVLAQLVDALQRLALVRPFGPHRVDLLRLLGRVEFVRPLDLLFALPRQGVLFARDDQPNCLGLRLRYLLAVADDRHSFPSAGELLQLGLRLLR